MFNKLKEKLKSWTKKVSTEVEKNQEKEEIELPTKFDVAKHKFEPKLEKVEETIQKKESTKTTIKEQDPPKPGEKGFFKRITSKINTIKISQTEFDVYEEELKMLLLENNVAFEVAEKIIKKLSENIIGKELLKKEIEGEITEAFKDIINEILINPFKVEDKIKEKQDKPYIILFCGINGTGKTTTIAKIAEQLKKQKISSVLAAADTFRAASIEQLNHHGDKIGVKVISHDYGSDPASVGFDAIKYAKKQKLDSVLIDTAGRMHTSKNLLKEIEKISRVCKPDLTIFVGESITGNDIIEQVKTFDWEIGIDGIILTKADIDEKGGTALSVGYTTKKPILYLGTGQNYGDVEQFDKKKFIERLGL
jgi:fused signal recognition particle receptor